MECSVAHATKMEVPESTENWARDTKEPRLHGHPNAAAHLPSRSRLGVIDVSTAYEIYGGRFML